MRSFFPVRSKQLPVFPAGPPAVKIKPGIKELRSEPLPAATVWLHIETAEDASCVKEFWLLSGNTGKPHDIWRINLRPLGR